MSNRHLQLKFQAELLTTVSYPSSPNPAYPAVLVCSGFYDKNTTNWGAYKQQTLSFHNSRKCEIESLVDLVSGKICFLRDDYLFIKPHMAEGTS